MARYGDLDKVLELVNEVNEDGNFTSYAHYSYLFDSIDNLPTIEQPERKKGKWIGCNTEQDGWKRTDGSPVFMSCSECNGLVLNNGSAHWNYCPNCGARMEGEANE